MDIQQDEFESLSIFEQATITPAYQQGFQAGAASRDAEVAELVAVLELLSKYIAYNGDDWVQRTALEALAKVRKP